MHNQPPDRPTDIYGLGAVAYFTLTGRPPFLGQTAMEVMVAHARDPVPPLSQFRTDIPSDLEAVVLRCLAKNPKDRYRDTASLARALDACADAPNWSPEHAAHWWQTTAKSSPNTNNRTVAVPVAITQECPVPTQEMESAEVPRIM
jgi:serine/threonine protein kinase